MHDQRLRPTILKYGIFFLAPLVVLYLKEAPSRQAAEANLNGPLRQKVAYYRRHADEYNLVFLGDSRTYCGLHADIMDGHLGTRSLNLASFAHWFPTQYPQFQDLVARIPENTTVVWSIGRQNFHECGDSLWAQNSPYFIGGINALRYWWWGFPVEAIGQNLSHYSGIKRVRDRLRRRRTKLERSLDRVVWSYHPMAHTDAPAPPPTTQPPPKTRPTGHQPPRRTASNDQPEGDVYLINDQRVHLSDLIGEHQRNPRIARVEVNRDGDTVTSLTLYRRGGSYYRIELTPDYFRDKQRRSVSSPYVDDSDRPYQTPPFTPDPHYWTVFTQIVDLFARHNIRLVVNEMEEAPFTYPSWSQRHKDRQFMRQTVAPYVRQQGFDYVHVDFDRLKNDDYFDYNHLNSKGAVLYSRMLAGELRPLLMP